MNTKQHLWAYRMAFVWFALFSINALCTSIIASLTGAQWSQLDWQSRFMIVVAVTANWTGTIMAFVSKQAKRIEEGKEPSITNGDTEIISKTTVTTAVTPPAKP